MKESTGSASWDEQKSEQLRDLVADVLLEVDMTVLKPTKPVRPPRRSPLQGLKRFFTARTPAPTGSHEAELEARMRGISGRPRPTELGERGIPPPPPGSTDGGGEN
jgi:hypothetical protein